MLLATEEGIFGRVEASCWSWEIHSGGKYVGDGTMVEVSHQFYLKLINMNKIIFFIIVKVFYFGNLENKGEIKKIKFIYR